jgi:chitinase
MFMRRLRLFVLLVVVGCLLVTTLPIPATAQITPRIVAYFSSWSIYQKNFFITDIAADKLTHINYAFANVSDEGECLLGDEWADTQYPYEGDKEGEALLGNFKQLNLLKEAHLQLQTLISVGGWTWSGKFSDVALTDESRKKFAASCVDFMTRYGFDGLDIDWEYPAGGGDAKNVERPEDPANFVLLMKELRTQLDAQTKIDGKHHLLTIATGADVKKVTPIDWEAVHPNLDFINVMAYDFAGSWSTKTGFNAPLFDVPGADPGSADTAMKAYVAAGIPADKLVLGVPFYGRGWKEVKDVNDGLFQPYGDIPGTEGSFEYRELASFWIKHSDRHWNEAGKVPWLFIPATGMMISYDDPESLKAKTDYVKENGFGGIMIWELVGDDPERTLLNSVYDGLMK